MSKGLGPVIFKLNLFQSDRDRWRSQTCLLWLLEALVQINITWLHANPSTPLLYAAPVRYDFNPNYPDAWKDIPTILADGQGDCEDLSCWRIAELRAAGISGVRPFIRWRRNSRGGFTYHVLVRWPNGEVEDPNLAMGMRGPMTRQQTFVEPDLEETGTGG